LELVRGGYQIKGGIEGSEREEKKPKIAKPQKWKGWPPDGILGFNNLGRDTQSERKVCRRENGRG